MSENLSKLSARKGLKTNLFEETIRAKGDPVRLKELAKTFKVGEANLYSSSTAYDFIQGENANKKAYLCNGSSCLCANSQPTVQKALEEHIDSEDIGHVTCLGRCHENAAFQINGINYSGEAIKSLPSILNKENETTNLHSDTYPVKCLLDKPILTESIDDTESYYQLLADLIASSDKPAILQTIIDSGLRGRGGAGFPTGIKWKSCAEQSNEEKYIVCNADEGDPGAFSDRYLMEHKPHAVLFGMFVAGYLAGAKWGVLYIRDEYPESVAIIQKAINEFEALNNLPPAFDFQFKIIRGAGAYICGEETALLRSIEGQKPTVSVRPPFPTVKGLFGKPTILNNVETFAAIHWILEHSSDAYAAHNNENNASLRKTISTGSKLISLDGHFSQPGIYEVAMGQKLSEVIKAAGGYSKPLKALHIGGPLGGLVPITKVDDLTVDFESFAEQGFLLGHASIIGIPESQPIPQYIEHLFEFTAAESCGKCFPCRLGATRGKEMFNDANNHKQSLNQQLLEDLLETMEQGSLCALGGGVPLPVKNALQHFPDEFQPLFDSQIVIKEVH